MDLSNTDLAVLSACETGIGKEFKGEGVFSMARGFAYAGCPSIVMSLWKVNDKFTADLMARFYKHLNKGNKISESLSKSKLEFLQESDQYSAHPSNWAAFVPVGKNTELSNQNYTFYYIILVVVALLVLVLIRRSRKRSVKNQNQPKLNKKKR